MGGVIGMFLGLSLGAIIEHTSLGGYTVAVVSAGFVTVAYAVDTIWWER